MGTIQKIGSIYERPGTLKNSVLDYADFYFLEKYHNKHKTDSLAENDLKDLILTFKKSMRSQALDIMIKACRTNGFFKKYLISQGGQNE